MFDWLIISLGNDSLLRRRHTAGKERQNTGVHSTFVALSREPTNPCLPLIFDNQGIQKTYLNPDPHGIIMSALPTYVIMKTDN